MMFDALIPRRRPVGVVFSRSMFSFIFPISAAFPRSGTGAMLRRFWIRPITTTATELARATVEDSGLINGVIYPTDRRAPVSVAGAVAGF
jgi:hypothetical protein